ncbi:MAG: response regulator [Bermanella sp.]
MNYWGIQKRLLLITLLPCLVSAALLGSYFSFEQYSLLKKQGTEQAILLSQQLALQAANLLEQDTDTQLKTLKPFLNLPDMRGLALLDAMQKPIVNLGPRMLEVTSKRIIEQQIHRFESNGSIIVRAPIFAPEDELKTSLLGWIELEFTTKNTQLSQYQALLSSLILILSLCTLALYLAYRASASITRPLQRVASTLEQLESGNLEARIQLSEQTEFNELANGINSMAASLQRAQQELQGSIEQATQDLKETLEEMEVQNIELNLARRSALESSNIKSEFLANMSHEIRTPLNGILGFSKLLEKTRLNKRQQEYLNTIEVSSSSLLSIINDILDFSKIEAGKLVLDSIPVHIRDIADEVLSMLAPEAHKKSLELTALVYQDVPSEIMADPVRIKQVLTNLVSNAIKFTESGSVIVRIMVEEQIKQKVALKITISDTGIGLNQEQQKNLFKAFSQADASTTRRYGGTGLGLVISSYLVEHMQGDIGFNSKINEGSQFWFTGQFNVCSMEMDTCLDAPWYQKSAYMICNRESTRQALQHQLNNLGFKVEVFREFTDLLQAQTMHAASVCFIEVDDQTNYKQVQLIQEQSEVVALLPNNESHFLSTLHQHHLDHNLVYPISYRRLRQTVEDLLGDHIQTPMTPLNNTPLKILAVDDNAPNLELLSTWLQDLNVQVIKANGGIEAVKLGSTEKFDLIFMDIQMPDLDGVRATQEIRQQPINAHTALVALTAHALPTERKKLLQSGFDDYLTKPISEEQLIHTLTKWTHFQKQSKPVYNRNLPEVASLVSPTDKALALDWEVSLKLAGGKTELAKTMLLGLISEARFLQEKMKTEKPQNLLEIVHKTHGLCKYVGAENLRLALESAEICLKTTGDTWPSCQQALQAAIEELLSWDKESQWLERLNEIELN